MTKGAVLLNEDVSAVVALFEREIGVTKAPFIVSEIGDREFIHFQVGRDAPLYRHAIFRIQKELSDENPFKGAVSLSVQKTKLTFPKSIEASSLLTLISPSTRVVSQNTASGSFKIPFIPFQNREDHLLAQAATHIVRGRRGVGKSTLIGRSEQILSKTSSISVVLDMQSYSLQVGDDLILDVVADLCSCLAEKVSGSHGNALAELSIQIISGAVKISRAPAALKRLIGAITRETSAPILIFLDDFHLVDSESQPTLLHYLHASVKGANGWLKVAGLSSLLNTYAPAKRHGLQIPGDAQAIALDLTLENPEAAEAHLSAILDNKLG